MHGGGGGGLHAREGPARDPHFGPNFMAEGASRWPRTPFCLRFLSVGHGHVGKNTSLRADYASGAGLCGRCCCCLWWVVLVGGCACVWAVVRGWLWMVRQLCARVNVAVVVFGGGAAGGGGGGEDGGGGGGAGAGWGGKR